MTDATVQTADGKHHHGRITDWYGPGRCEVEEGRNRWIGRVVPDTVPADSYIHPNRKTT